MTKIKGSGITIREYDDRYRETEKAFLVFVNEDRPFNKGDIKGDFEWRRNHRAPVLTEGQKATVERIVKGEYPDRKIKSIKYDRMAGCSMCPCSPGFVVRLDAKVLGCRKAIWFD